MQSRPSALVRVISSSSLESQDKAKQFIHEQIHLIHQRNAVHHPVNRLLDNIQSLKKSLSTIPTRLYSKVIDDVCLVDECENSENSNVISIALS